MMLRTLALAFALLVVSVAAKPPEIEPSISLRESNPSLGDTVHFDYVLPKGVKEECNYKGNCARIQLVCSQDGETVYAEAQPAEYNHFLLGGGASVWLARGGAASCTATLYRWENHAEQTFVPFAETDFEAGG